MKADRRFARRHYSWIGLVAVAIILVVFPGLCFLFSVLPSSVPYWIFGIAPVFLLVLLILIVIDMRRRDQRLRNGQCVECGYDLRESPLRCPECGARKIHRNGEP